ncbi:MAG TPA: glycosyltransferase family 4 protein [Terriglobia bacterium]|nr:glycosyltransferase family 4 protein [Terriglobia bacterium]
MKVLILATDIYTRGGIARYTATLATALGQLMGPSSVDLLPLLDDSERRFTPKEYRILEATTAKLRMIQKIRHAARALRCANSGSDLVVCSHVGLAPIAALIRLRHGTPYFVVCHGSEAWEVLPRLKRVALEQADAVLAVSQFTAGAVAKANGIPNAKIRLLPNAIPEDMVRRLVDPDSDADSERMGPDSVSFRAQPRPMSFRAQRGISLWTERKSQTRFLAPPRYARNDSRRISTLRPADRWPELRNGGLGNGPLLLSVGSLKTEHAYKGVDTVIEALPRIIGVVPGVRYLVVGDGDNRPNLERLAAARGVSERVTFAGEVTDADLAEHYRACDLFVLPSRTSLREGSRPGTAEGEGFGRVYAEAALAGKPVVGSRDGGAAEAVLHGRTGLLVNPRSTEEIATAVIALLTAPERAAAMGAEGRCWALENFTVEAMRRSLESVLSSVVPNQSSQSSVFSSQLVVSHARPVAHYEQRSTNHEVQTADN